MFAYISLTGDEVLDHYQAYALEKNLQLFYQKFTPEWETYSPWAFFLALGREKQAREMVFAIWEELIPAYGREAVIGLGPSKLLCRAVALLGHEGSRLTGLILEEGPRGLLLTLPVEHEREVRRQLPLEVLWPLNPKLRQQLLKLGFKTWGEVEELSPEQLQVHLGEEAYFTWTLAGGQLPGKLKRPKEGLQVAIAWEEGMRDAGPSLDRGAKKLALALEEQWLGCRELSLEGITQAGQSFWQKRLFLKPRSGIACLQGEARRLWQKLNLKVEPRELWLKAEGLEPVVMEQLNLFAGKPAAKIREEQLEGLLNRLRKDYPTRVLERAGRWYKSRREQMLSFYDPWRFQ